MVGFKEWISTNPYAGSENVDSKIDLVYDKAKYAVKLVQLYDQQTKQKLLNNITTIAPLNSGVYGLYNSAENKKIIGKNAADKIRFKFGQNALSNNNLEKLPNAVIKQHIPDIDDRQLVPSDVIRVNVQRIVRELGDNSRAVVEIAATIVHEATHEIHFQIGIKDSETQARQATDVFKNWVQKNWNLVLARIPEFKNF